MQATCGNCGKPVEGSDIICPHCGVLLAAYASPSGSTAISVDEPLAPAADAIKPVQMDEPALAAEIDIPDEVQAVSSAPRPLFDTHVTIEEIKEAADGNNDEALLVVDEDEVASKPVAFETPG